MASGLLRFWVAGVVLLAGLLATGLLARSTKSRVDMDEKEDFTFACSEIRSKIVERFRAHEQILRSGAAFLAHSVGASRQEWRFFTENQQLETQLPGIQGIGFSLMIPRSKLAQHIQEIRAEGFSGYDVFPKGYRELYTSIVYLEPFTNRNLRAFGYDMFNEPVRREAMERARDENTAALSGKVTLVQETGQEVQAGTLMYVPVYRRGLPHETVPQRRAAILGWAYSPYRMNDLLGGILGNWDQASQKRIHLEIFDGEQVSAQALLYDSQAARSERSSLAADALPGVQSRIVLAGRPWTLCFTRTGIHTDTVDYSKVWLVGFGGGSLSLFLAALTCLLLNSLGQARQLALELKQSEERYRTMLDGSPHAVFLTDASGRIRMANQVAATLAGRQDARDLVGGLLADLVLPAQRAYVQLAIQTILQQGFTTPFGYTIPRQDGTVAYTELSGTVVKDFQGLPTALQAIMQDVTDRKRVDAAMRDLEQRYRLLLNDMLDGFAYCRMIVDARQEPVDFIYLSVNPAFEKLTGLSGVVGQKATEVVPRLAENQADLFKIYGRVTATGKPEKFEVFVPGLKKWLSVSATQAGQGCFATIFQDFTDRKSAEEALRQSEEKYRVLFENEIYAICIFDLVTLRMLDVNDAFGRLYGYHREEILAGMTIHDFSAEPESSSTATDRASQDGTIFVPLRYHRRRDGAVFPVEIVGGPYQWQGQRVMFVLIHDISSRHQAEQALRVSQEHLEEAQQVAHIGNWSWDLESNQLVWSKENYRIFGLAPETPLQAERFLQMVHPDDINRVMAAVNQAKRDCQPFVLKFRIQTATGKERIVENIVRVQVGAHNHPRRFFGTNQDVTEREQMGATMRLQATLLENLSEGIYIIGLDDRLIKWANPIFEWMFGYEAGEMLGMHVDQVNAPTNRTTAQTWTAREKALQATGHWHGEVENRKKDGSRFWCLANASLFDHAQFGKVILAAHTDITERKRAEEKLRTSEERHRIHAHFAIDNFWTMGVDRAFTYFSQSIERLVGFTPAEYLALPLAEMLTADSLAIAMKYLDTMAAATQAGMPAEDFRGEMELKHKNGSTVWTEITATWIYDGEGKIVELFGITRDISARKQMEGELHKTKERLEATLNALPDLMFRVDQKGCIHEYHTAATGKLFVSPSLFLGKKFTEVIPEKAADTIMAAIESARLHGSHHGATYSLPFPQGEAWFELSIAAMRGLAEKDSQLIVLARDITARKQMEEKLRFSEEQYRLLAENISDVIWILDLDSGSFRYISPSVERLRGYTVEEALAQDMRQAVTQDSRARLQSKLPERMQAFREGCHHVYTDELEQSCKNGSTVWAETSTRFVLNETNGHLEVFGVSRNISERKRFEAEREKLQAQAHQLQKAESLNRMAGAVAHHFNNQLAAIMLGLDLTKHDWFPNQAFPAQLQDVMHSARQAAEVSTLLLTYLGQTASEQEPLDLAHVCQSSLPHLQKLLPQGVLLQTNFPSAGPVVDSSATQIRQILTNLITNAFEACGDRSGTIQLTVTTMAPAAIPMAHRFPVDTQPAAGAYACLEVADNGCGISPQDIDKIFDPFFSTKFTGRGLGLPVVLGMVRSHQGFAAVASQPGSGSVFRVFLPLSAKTIPAKPAVPASALDTAHGGTILLAEDDNGLRSVVARALKLFGYRVYAAQDGAEALELFKQHQDEIICVLSDLTMPHMDGWETLSAIRQIAPDLPVILASGYSESQALAGHYGELPQAFLSKPYDIEILKEIVARVLKRENAP